MLRNDSETGLLDETDLALVDALQINPRASWTKLGRVLGMAPITLARRWQRLEDRGAAWVSIANSNARTRGGIIELTCAPGAEMEVAARLAELPYFSTVGIPSGEYHVFANLVAQTQAGTTNILLNGLPPLPNVIRMRSHVFGSLFGGMVWRLGVMNTSHTEQIREAIGPPPQEIRPFGLLDRELFLALSRDGPTPTWPRNSARHRRQYGAGSASSNGTVTSPSAATSCGGSPGGTRWPFCG